MRKVEFESFVEKFRASAARAGFVLDFDGTLSAVVREPDSAVPVEGTAEVLEALSSAYRVVALVSGRRALDLESIVGARGVLYLGLYGAERIAEGGLVQPPEAEAWRGMASRLARDAEALILSEGLEGAEVEYKDLAVSFHYRRATSPGAADAIRTWAASAAPRRGFEAGVGRMVVEMRPAGVSKASTVESLVAENGLSWLVVAGDDYQDVEAMERAHELLGDRALTIGVASAEEPEDLGETADVVADSPVEVLRLLRGIRPPVEAGDVV